MRDTIREPAEIDQLLLAERAEVRDKKLYLWGGGIDQIPTSHFPRETTLHVAVGILVPWSEVEATHAVRVWLEDEDGAQLGAAIDERMVGRLVGGTMPGQAFRAFLAHQFTVEIPRPGTYRFLATINGGDPKTAVFHLVQGEELPVTL